MMTRRATACILTTCALILGGCSESEEPTETTQATDSGETRSPFDVDPQGAIPRDAAERGMTPSNQQTSAPTATGDSFRAGGITFDIPEGWESQPPSSSMRAAELVMPSAQEGAEDAVLAVFAGIGGTVDQNINRWIGQVSNPTDGPTRETMAVNGLEVHTVMLTGTFSAGMAMGGGAPQPGTTLLGAVVTGGPGGPVHLKATGPESTVKANLEEWEALLSSAEAG